MGPGGSKISEAGDEARLSEAGAAQAMVAAFDVMNVAAVVCRADAAVAGVARAALPLLTDGLLALNNRQLTAPRRANAEAFAAALREAAAGAASTVVLLRVSDEADTALRVEVLRPRLEPAADLLVLLLAPWERVPPTDVDHRLRRHGLTESEIKVALAVARGASARDIARDRGTSVQTVRDQIKAVLRKTGCKRQLDLIRMLQFNPVRVDG